jgi:peptidoglycan/xylan/chitin deacetylase (PgdA/CDA1 family)/folate-dependent phosphoribosylglycinamide formyltransferase PurN
VRREGAGYVPARIMEVMVEATDALAARIVPRDEVDALLRRAFPDESFSLQELASRLGIPLIQAGNLNSAGAASQLAALDADLGAVVGTRILKRSTFGAPRLGCINLHEGKVPEYRGLPPGFWELYEGAATAGVTVHFVDEGLDTGDIVATDTIPIHPHETPISLGRKLDRAGAALLAAAVAAIADGSVLRRPQPSYRGPARTSPTRAQRKALAARSTHPAADGDESALQRLVKNVCYLTLHYLGAVPLLRRLRRGSRGCIVLYHRVNDISVDALTASRRRFAEQLILLRRHYDVRPSSWLVDRIRRQERIEPTTVAIHFDDGYADVWENAVPLLEAAQLPAACFISTGFLDSTRRFAHDEAVSPHRFHNMTSDHVRALPSRGIEVGAHTANHVDMGRIEFGEAAQELLEPRAVLEGLTGAPVRVLSFPFGRPENFRTEVAHWTRATGYDAIFSAYGGFITEKTSPWDIPRIGGYEGNRPLYLLFEIEGLALSTLRGWFVRRR